MVGALYVALSNPIALTLSQPVYAAPAPKSPTNPLLVKIADVAPLNQSSLAEQSEVVYTPPAPPDARSYALSVVGSAQFACLDALWTGESNWNIYAYNPSGAYGIPQSLPAAKMAAFGADYLTNPVTQINWGLDYISQSYGTPCNAYYTWLNRSPHWY